MDLPEEHGGTSKKRQSRRRRRNHSGSDGDESCRELSPTDARHQSRAHDLRDRLNSKHRDRSPRRERKYIVAIDHLGARGTIEVGPKAFTRRLAEVDWPGTTEKYDNRRTRIVAGGLPVSPAGGRRRQLCNGKLPTRGPGPQCANLVNGATLPAHQQL